MDLTLIYTFIYIYKVAYKIIYFHRNTNYSCKESTDQYLSNFVDKLDLVINFSPNHCISILANKPLLVPSISPILDVNLLLGTSISRQASIGDIHFFYKLHVINISFQACIGDQ